MIAQKVLMVRPKSFRCNEETLSSNTFQSKTTPHSDVALKSQQEFDQLHQLLTDHSIQVHLFQEPDGANTPDALFPNNWFCQLPSQEFFVFPMEAQNRRREVHLEWLDSIARRPVYDLRSYTDKNLFLEGTGSLILDHINKKGYACLSSRTHYDLVREFERLSQYKISTFVALDKNEKPIYHTNVIMALSRQTALLCLESFASTNEARFIYEDLERSGRQIIDITLEQVKRFAGNMLFLKNSKDELFWVCSERAFQSLTAEQKNQLQQEGEFLYSPLTTIEDFGGGSARCMLAEIF